VLREGGGLRLGRRKRGAREHPNHTNGPLIRVSGYTGTVAGQAAGIGITYWPNVQVNQVAHANTVTDTIQNDPNFMNRPKSISAAAGATTLWNTGIYAYDGAGNIKSIGSASFAYDGVSRLVSSTQYLEPVTPARPRTQSYAFDAFGNIQSVTTNGTTVNTPTSSATNRMSAPVYYDSAGNVTSNGGQNYVYDALNQMIRFCASTCLTSAGTQEDWTYFYDADDERVWASKNFQATYRWTLRDLGAKVLREYDLANGVSTLEDYIYRSGQLLASDGTAGPKHFSLDHLGTVRLATNGSGQKLGYHVYYPFGQEAFPDVANGTTVTQDGERMRFAGHERDLGALSAVAQNSPQADDLDYMHARFYKPQLARFLSTDPALTIRRAIRRPQLWNRYGYGLGNPLKYVDPTGETFVLSGCASGGSKQCDQQKSMLQQALGDNYAFVSVGKDGTVSLRLSAAGFGSLGTFEHGFGSLVGSGKTFTLFAGRDSQTIAGLGARTVVTRDFWGRQTGAEIHIDPAAFPSSIGGVMQTTGTALVHEVGHAAGTLYGGAADAVNTMTMGDILYKGEGYPVTFENRYRAEHGLDQREYYREPGDYSPFVPSIMDIFTP